MYMYAVCWFFLNVTRLALRQYKRPAWMDCLLEAWMNGSAALVPSLGRARLGLGLAIGIGTYIE